MWTETDSDLANGTKSRISGKLATGLAMAAGKYPPVEIGAADDLRQSRVPRAVTTSPEALHNREINNSQGTQSSGTGNLGAGGR